MANQLGQRDPRDDLADWSMCTVTTSWFPCLLGRPVHRLCFLFKSTFSGLHPLLFLVVVTIVANWFHNIFYFMNNRSFDRSGGFHVIAVCAPKCSFRLQPPQHHNIVINYKYSCNFFGCISFDRLYFSHVICVVARNSISSTTLW